MPAFSAAIFDFDGTLADSFAWFIASLDQTADHFGIKRVDPTQIESLRDLSSREALIRLGVPFWKLPQMAIYLRNLFYEGIDTIAPFAGATEMLAALHAASVKLAVVSSNAEINVRHVLGEAAGLIGVYACGSSLWGKAEKFGRVLRLLGEAPACAIAIGDEIRDIEAARQAGLAAGVVSFGYNSRRALEGAAPDRLFDSYDELVTAVAG
ncbi:MAG TPA: HAD hydrolase-like protein [Devosia sp.]|nr:HAD hydrolase-like protein [Devosia sp.]